MPGYTHIEVQDRGGVRWVTFPTGRFDGNAVRELFECAMELLDAPHPKLLVDTAGVALVPSGGMGMLVTIRKRFLGRGGQLHVALPDALVRQSFEVASMGRLLSLFDDAATAAGGFK